MSPDSSASHSASRLADIANGRRAFELRGAIGNFFCGEPQIMRARFHRDAAHRRCALRRASAELWRWRDARCGSASRTPLPDGSAARWPRPRHHRAAKQDRSNTCANPRRTGSVLRSLPRPGRQLRRGPAAASRCRAAFPAPAAGRPHPPRRIRRCRSGSGST